MHDVVAHSRAEPVVHRITVAAGQAVALDWYPASPGARTALFVQGLGSSRRGAKSRYFAQRFNDLGWAFAAVDLRGHGDSDGDVRDLTMSGMLADVDATMDWLARHAAVRDPVLVGSSMGAAVVVWHTLRKLASQPLVMLGPSLEFPSGMTARIGVDELKRWRRSGLRRFKSEWIDLEIGYGLVSDARNYDPEAIPHDLMSPTLIVHGMRDQVVDWRASVEFASQCRRARVDVYLVGDGDHRLTDHRQVVFDVMWSWLTGPS